MLKQFHPRFPEPAWAGGGSASPFFMSRREGRRGSAGGDWGENPRTRRGDIKFMLLELLSEQPQHGYELMKALESRQGGFRRPSPGSVYPTLQMLEEGGYLTSEEVDGKRVYTVTESGKQFLSDRNQQSYPRNASDSSGESKSVELIELRHALTEVNDAVTQVARSRNSELANQVRDLLVQVKREIYKRLAE
jgi:DNA-binding PadR family transcriptional regulator